MGYLEHPLDLTRPELPQLTGHVRPGRIGGA